MAVELFKKNDKGEVVSELFDIKRFRYHLESGGYVLDRRELEAEPEIYENFLQREAEELDRETEEAEERLREEKSWIEEELREEDDELEELREEAKVKRIRGWHQIKSVDKLREKIAVHDNQD